MCTCKWLTSSLFDLSLGYIGSLNTGATKDTCVNADLGKNGLNKYNIVFLWLSSYECIHNLIDEYTS